MPVGTHSLLPSQAPSTPRRSHRIVHFLPPRPGRRSRSVDLPHHVSDFDDWMAASARTVRRSSDEELRPAIASTTTCLRSTHRTMCSAWPSHRVRTVARRQAPGFVDAATDRTRHPHECRIRPEHLVGAPDFPAPGPKGYDSNGAMCIRKFCVQGFCSSH
jgi:hypothetical protein